MPWVERVAGEIVGRYAQRQTGFAEEWLEPDDTQLLPPLDQVKAERSAAVDERAGRERIKYITDIPGQELTYREKVDEAKALADDLSPDPANYPMLSGEVGVTADTLAGVGEIILARYAAWQQIGSVIERNRLTLKAQIAGATDADEIAALDIEAGWTP